MNNSLPPTTSALPADAVPAGLTRLGHYELLDCIGRGGMGLVYRARDTRLDRQVAIKCLRTELFEAHYVERFKREALLLAKLNHPNIVQIYDFIEAPDQLALVMELVEGQNLQLHLREHIVPFSQRMRWLAEIAQGLAVAHDAGIIHRDLKAENILINQRKVAKITDLGIAKSQDFNATLTDHVAGSYCSMSPEQAMGEAIDFKSDLFSFGILAYQLLCGAHPFGDTNNKLQLMQRIISHPPAAPSNHNPDLPSEINDLLGQLLSKDPAKRPDNTHWVATQLETLSHLQPANDFASDDTQVLIAGGSAANQSHVKNTGIASAVRTQDHPTFETRFVAINTAPKKSYWLPIKNHLLENKISVGFGLFSVLILAAVVIWQLQPKPPKYIAVIPPKLTSEGMQESQQELVKGAVYDAIQQSVIQLDGYYLIPQNEITDINADTNKEGFETVQRATAADELITTEITCKIEACAINLTRLTPDNTTSRLRIKDVKTIDVLTENYLSITNIIRKNIASSYGQPNNAQEMNFSIEDYKNMLEINKIYRQQGASPELLKKLDNTINHNKNESIYTDLYRDISLDLHYETNDNIYLEKLENHLNATKETTSKKNYLLNSLQLNIAQKKFTEAKAISREIISGKADHSTENELNAYIQMAERNFEEAIARYSKAIKIRKTAENLYHLANAYWYSGNIGKAKEALRESIELAPNYVWANSLSGLISLYSGDLHDAKNTFQKLIRHRPNDASNLNNLGLCYLLDNQPEKAVTLFDKAYSLAPQNTTYLLNKGDAENLLGNSNHQKTYQKIIDATSDTSSNSLELRNRAQAHAHLGDIRAALKTLQTLEKKDPQNIDTTYTASLVHALANNLASATFNAENTIRNGMQPIWFNFPWFKKLCQDKNFYELTQIKKEGNICLPSPRG